MRRRVADIDTEWEVLGVDDHSDSLWQDDCSSFYFLPTNFLRITVTPAKILRRP